MDEKKGWVLVLGVLMIMLLVSLAVVWVVYDVLQNTVAPVQSMSGELATQVSSFLNPTPTVLPSPLTIIRDIRSLSRLETIQFSIEKVITAERNQTDLLAPLIGDKLILVAHGNVIAGLDLSKIRADDVQFIEGSLILTLPEPEIFVATLDNKKTYVYDRDTGLLTKGNIQLESDARSVAEDEVRKAAIENGILDIARQNGELYLERLLGDLGYPDVLFQYRQNPATPTP